MHVRVAIMRDNSKFIAMGRTTFTRPQIQVYSSAGALLMTLNVRAQPVLVISAYRVVSQKVGARQDRALWLDN